MNRCTACGALTSRCERCLICAQENQYPWLVLGPGPTLIRPAALEMPAAPAVTLDARFLRHVPEPRQEDRC